MVILFICVYSLTLYGNNNNNKIERDKMNANTVHIHAEDSENR